MSWQKLICAIMRHRYHVVRPLLIGGDLWRCGRCGKEICVHHGRKQTIPYDAEIEKFEADIRRLMAKYTDAAER